MEVSGQLLESLDSVWFFCNVFLTRAQSSNGNTHKEHSPKPTNPRVQTQKIQSPNKDSSPKCTKCCEFAVEIESPSVQLQEITIEEAKKEERSSRRKRKSKRKILGELDMGFDGMTTTYFGDFGVLEFNYEKTAGTCGYGMFTSKQHLVNMPPLSDGMAMKEHLKSWAYAVACTVR